MKSNLVRIFLLSILPVFTGCGKKPDVVLTPQQEADYARMMNTSPKPTYQQLQDENARLKYEAEQRALDKR